jgi:tetratricopeptide (TPR) repeat protein
MMTEPATDSRPVEIFYSYAHEDRQLRERLDNHLKILQRQGLISQWHDQLITPGTDWGKEIHASLERASVILFLISEYFLASDYADGVEVRRARERADAGDARVVPVILRMCPWRDDERLARLQALPAGARPVTRWRDRADAFADIAAGIKAVVQDLVPLGSYGVAASAPLAANEIRQIESLSAIWNVPLARNPSFVDRESELGALDRRSAADPESRHATVISGPPGIGKTCLVTEFAYRHAGDYDVVWWVRAQHESTVSSDLHALAWALRLGGGATDPGETSAALTEWLATSSRYLLIFDDASDPELVVRQHATNARGDVLITSERAMRPAEARSLKLQPVSIATSVEFLTRQLGKVDPSFARNLARRLKGMPSALGLATSYLAQSKETLSEFLDDLDQGATGNADLASGPAAPLNLVLDQLESTHPVCRDFLELLAYLSPEDIPLDDISMHAASLSEPLGAGLRDPTMRDDMVEVLIRFGLAWRAGDALFVPGHIQQMVRESMSPGEQGRWSAEAVRLLDVAFPENSRDVQTWRSCARLIPHVLTAVGHGDEGAAATEAGRILRRSSVYFLGRAQLDDAKSVATRALEIHRRHKAGNAEIASDLAALGRVYQAMDDLGSARDCFVEAVALNEATFGTDDPKVVRDLTYLGRFLRRIRDLDGARVTLERAVRIAKRAKEPNRRDLSSAMGQLGRVLQELGQLKKARTVLSTALKIDEADLGPTHPDVATELVNLARVLRELKELDTARAHLDRALAITTDAFGADHYEVAIVLANLGRVMQDLGDGRAAEGHLAHAVELLTSSLGEEHSFTTTAREWLEAVRRAQQTPE